MLVNDTWDKSPQPDYGQNMACLPADDPSASNSCGLESGWVLVMERDGCLFCNSEFAAYNAYPGARMDFTGQLTDLTGPVDEFTRKLSGSWSKCDNKPCAITNTYFGPTDNKWGGWPPGFVKDAYQDKDYSTRLDIEAGEKYFAPESPVLSTGGYFYLCNGETEGKVVHSAPYTSEYLGTQYPSQDHAKTPYKCSYNSYSGYTWSEYDECFDGIDNDGDGRIDTDTMCSNSDYEENYPELSASTPVIPMVVDRQLVYYQTKTDLVRYTGQPAEGVGGIADIDGTGKPEIVYYSTNGDLRIYDADSGDSTLLKESVYSAGPLVDIDEDGTYETFYEDSGDQIAVEVDSGSTTTFSSCGGYGIGPETADIDEDGSQEIFVDPRGNMPVSLIITDGSGCEDLHEVMDEYRDDSSQNMAYPGGTGDIDGNGKPDITYQLLDLDQTASATDYMAYGDSESYTNTGVEEKTPGPITDADNDGDTELVYATRRYLKVYNPDSGSTSTIKSVQGLGSGEPGIQSLGGSWYKSGGGGCTEPIVGIWEHEEASPTSGPSTGGTYTVREKAVFMDSSPDGSYTNELTGCKYNEIDDTIETGQPDIFICDGTSAVENSATGDDSVTASKDTYCQYEMVNREYPGHPDPQRRCSGDGDCDLGDYHNYSVNRTALAVEYYVPKEGIPVGEKGSEFAASDGFKNTRYDHIHAAEESLTECEPEGLYECPQMHQNSTYSDLDIAVGDAYDGTVDGINETEIRQLWNPSNATAMYSSDIRATTEEGGIDSISVGVNTTDVFNGGFYPSCETGLQWGYDETPGPTGDRWECTGAIDWTLDIYAFEPSGTQQKDPAGYFAMPWEFRPSSPDFSTYYSAKAAEETETAASIEEIRTVCWAGGLNDRPEFNSGNKGQDWFARQVSGIGDSPEVPVPVIGELELGSSDNVYSCRFEFDNSAGETVTGEGRLKVVSSDDVAEQQTKAQSILTGTYNSNLQDSWFDIAKVCSGGSTCTVSGIVPDKDSLSGAVISNPTMNLRRIWQQNLSYSFNQMSSGDLSSYMKNGN